MVVRMSDLEAVDGGQGPSDAHVERGVGPNPGSRPGAVAAAGAAPRAFRELPDGFDELVPGPELGAVLDQLDRDSCNGAQLVRVLQARHRQVAWLTSQLLADMHALAYAWGDEPDGPPVRRAEADPHVDEEVAFALSWTTRAAAQQTKAARALLSEQPAVFAALEAGRIDLPRATVILDEVALLGSEQAAAVVAQILPDAEFLTTGRLRYRLRRLVLTVDPESVHKRHRAALRNRHVSCVQHKDGTATITGRHLPADKAVAAMDHLTRMAAATHHAGDPGRPRPADDPDRRGMGQIRADVMLDLLDGADPTVPAAEGGAGAVNPAPRKGVVEVTVELATLLCLADRPGELAGFGPVVAEMARHAAEKTANVAAWRFTITDDGRLVHEGRLRYRPSAKQVAYVRARDRRCQAPGCERPARQCDIDHIVAWDEHGPTIEDNLCTVCKRHHTAKHNGFQLLRTDFGLVWVSPRGRSYPVSYGRELDSVQRRILQEIINNGEHLTPQR